MPQSRRNLKRSAFLRALGAAMQARRARLNLTIVEVAARLGQSAAAVRHLEAGERNVTLLQLASIARVLGISLPELVTRAERLLSARPTRAKRRGG